MLNLSFTCCLFFALHFDVNQIQFFSLYHKDFLYNKGLNDFLQLEGT